MMLVLVEKHLSLGSVGKVMMERFHEMSRVFFSKFFGAMDNLKRSM